MTEYVYRRGRGQRVHWATEARWGLVSACSSWLLVAGTAANPVSIRMEDRCRGKGCANRWDEWLARTTQRALADAVERAHERETAADAGGRP